MEEKRNYEKSVLTKDFLKTDTTKTPANFLELPNISLPKGGGALRGLDEKFAVNAVNGTASFSVPLPFSPARGALTKLNLNYSSANPNGIFGLGWSLDLASIKRKTDKTLPRYLDTVDSDTFLFSAADDLVPEFARETDGSFSLDDDANYIIREEDSADGLSLIRYYRPRIESLFARIERWTEKATGLIKWRVINRDNVTALYGWTEASRIADPLDSRRIYEWLPEFSFDDKGNCAQYIYKAEDSLGLDLSLAHNQNRYRDDTLLYTNLYLEKILYCNKTPYAGFQSAYPEEADYFFQTVFDYGTLSSADSPETLNTWDYRVDSFSTYKAGFEIRTTRLCKRVLLFHYFSELEGASALVKSLDFTYDTNLEKGFTFLKAIRASGYLKKTDSSYELKSLPATEFTYQAHEWNAELKKLSADSTVHAPIGIDEKKFLFTDLFNEGLAGILSENKNAWYYKHNLGDGNFSAARLIQSRPSFQGLAYSMQLTDLDADGTKQLVSLISEPKGYYEIDDREEWQPFKNFQSMPNIDFKQANARLIDLNGDGKAELLITEDHAFTWYESRGREGFTELHRTPLGLDEELSPRILFADSEQSIFLADMSGDGLVDIVRIKHSSIVYWPNLGYGKFGNKVSMDSSPVLDDSDSFNPAYIRLVDIDGSGTSDLVYLGKNKISCWLNLSGNSFYREPFEIENCPEIHSAMNLSAIDLLGTGLICLTWSSPLNKDALKPLQYIDLMNSKKPHIMISYSNNLGKEVSLEYTPSTRFYLEDKLSARPWITKLHFPVYCVSKTTTRDLINGYQFSSLYKYHHGYYDHAEAEFRGFAMVEQIDTEDFEHWVKSSATNISSADLHQEPVISKSWFHTGAFLDGKRFLDHFKTEYWYAELAKQGFSFTNLEEDLDEISLALADNLPAELLENLSTDEWREAFRACKGFNLRKEVFAYDAPDEPSDEDLKKELTPFSVAAKNSVVELLQPKGQNKHAVFIVKEREARTYNYERNTEDPRITHTINLKLDEYANVLESASIVYPRLIADTSLPTAVLNEQNKTIISYVRNSYTNDCIDNDNYRLRLSSEVETYELKGLSKSTTYYQLSDFDDVLNSAIEVAYHEKDSEPSSATVQKRLIEHVRTNYRSNNLLDPLPLNELESLAIPYENYQLAYTPELLEDIYGEKQSASDLEALMLEGGFTHSLNADASEDDRWWIRSGTSIFLDSSESVSDAQQRFYVPVAYIDPYGAKSTVKYYKDYYFLIEETQDALANKNTVELFNFRTLSPRRMKDANHNISEVISDALGLVKVTAIYGKGDEADSLDGHFEYSDSVEDSLRDTFINAASSDVLIDTAKKLLKNATSFFVYDLDVYKNTSKPTVMASITREEHAIKNPDSAVQISFEYSNGLGAVTLKKSQAEPGLASQLTVNSDNTYSITEINTASLTPKQLRWIANGKTVINNKGSVVKQYEPFFSTTHKFEDLKELVETGITATKYYDAAGRLIRTEYASGTLSRIEFSAWQQKLYDPNDTILESDWYFKRSNRLIDTELNAAAKDPAREKLSADAAAKHANTPQTQYFDTLGRAILSRDHNLDLSTGTDIFHDTRVKRDLEGNLLSVIDARANTVMSFKYDMLGNKVYQESMDTGKRWLMLNIMAKPLRTWDERDFEFTYVYDILQRPTQTRVTNISLGLDNVYDRWIYGEAEPNPELKNLRGKLIRHYDTAGLVENANFDFKGSPLSTTRKLFAKYKELVNWIDVNLNLDLETDSYTFTTETDALGRITKQIAPDGSIILPSYNEAGLLNSEQITEAATGLTNTYITDIEYNERGAFSKIIYGNQVKSEFSYDKETYRLNRLKTNRLNGDPLQDWIYTYDPVGNITFIEDKNIPTVFFDNSKITGLASYTYDAIYRLVEASGRENNRALNFGTTDNAYDNDYKLNVNYGDSFAMRNYTQYYKYDLVGNISQMKHSAAADSWTRDYTYATLNNRLQSTKLGQGSNSYSYAYTYHAQHGYMLSLPHLEELSWNFREDLVKSIRQRRFDGGTPETTYYQYSSSGERVRKITENQAAPAEIATKKEERIYISGYELYKKHSGADAGLNRHSLSILEKGKRLVTIESRNDVDDGTNKRLVRYQLHNHLGSASLELDENAVVISYEEYHPFGTTAYQAKNSAIKSAAKRYRYTGMERDEETGLNYHGARYYLPWLGRWLNADPIGMGDGTNLYSYAKNHPINMADATGTQAKPEQLGFWQCREYYTGVTATYSGRGISPELRDINTGIYRMWTGDYSTKIQVGHMEKPFVLLRAGEVSLVGPQVQSDNASQGATSDKRMAAEARAAGQFARDNKGLDSSPSGVASKGTVNKPIPYSSAIAASKDRFVALGQASAPPAPSAPLISLPASTAPAPSLPKGQLSFSFVADESPQLSFNFNKPALNPPATPASPPLISSPAPQQLSLDFSKPAAVEPAPAPTPAPAAAKPAAPKPAPAKAPSAPAPVSSGGANLAGAVGRSVPFVAETEAVLVSGSYLAASSATTAPLAAPLMAAAEATPIVAGAGVVGAGVGHVARAGASYAGADQTTADVIGFGAAVATGAYIGTFVGGPVGTAVGAGLGAVVAGGLYLWSIN